MSDERNASSDTEQMRDFETFARELEEENPGLAEQRILREEAEAFEERLRTRLRQARGDVSQVEIARRMGLNAQSRVSRLEKGDADLSVEALYLYARAAGYVPVVSFVPASSLGGDQDAVETPQKEAAQVRRALGEVIAKGTQVPLAPGVKGAKFKMRDLAIGPGGLGSAGLGTPQHVGRLRVHSRLQRMHERTLERVSDDLVKLYGDIGAALGPDEEDEPQSGQDRR